MLPITFPLDMLTRVSGALLTLDTPDTTLLLFVYGIGISGSMTTYSSLTRINSDGASSAISSFKIGLLAPV